MAMAEKQAASFTTQANALFRKNLTYQKRNMKTNYCLIIFPILICSLFHIAQTLIDNKLTKIRGSCETATAKSEFGIPYSDSMPFCPIPRPPSWPPVMQIAPTSYDCSNDDKNCSAILVLTGGNQSFGQNLGNNLYSSGLVLNSLDVLDNLATLQLGSYVGNIMYDNFLDPAFTNDEPIYSIQSECRPNSTFSVPITVGPTVIQQRIECYPGSHLWRNSSSEMKDEIFDSMKDRDSLFLDRFVAAYDLLDSDENNFNVNIWYILRGYDDGSDNPIPVVHIPRLVNVVSNAYLQLLRGSGVKMLFDFVKEMPKTAETRVYSTGLSIFSPLLFTWVVLQLFPVILASLVSEKQMNTRIMMKMHGLGDGPYWMISYAYFFLLSLAYVFSLVFFGSVLGLKLFRMNSYGVQFVFYIIYINLQIAFSFFSAIVFSRVKTARVIAYIYTIASGLVGAIFQGLVTNTSFSRVNIVLLELLPCLSLYRGLHEFKQYSTEPIGMMWNDLGVNGMGEVLVIMLLEGIVLLAIAYYLDQVVSVGSGIRKHPLFFLKYLQKKPSVSNRQSLHGRGLGVSVQMEKLDVSIERKKVEDLLGEPSTNYAIICDSLNKIYPGKDGNPEKYAVRELSLALRRGECFGMLGPNGAGKTSSMNMMIGLMSPTSGAIFVDGLDIRTDMDKVYTSMGVCPQHDLLWDTLTGREHLFFYGRLKNLKGTALTEAVEESLKNVSLFDGGVGDKHAGKYSGGMKRRLSVAISLIGNPKVVYMDEPSSGLDPASRNLLWDVVKRAKKNCAIVLTTHSMQEVEVLCDRLGIVFDGSLQCIGYPTELKARYGGSCVFTVTTDVGEEKEAENLAHQLSPSANKIYHISGTQKFEVPKNVRIADVFRAVENAKSKCTIHAWGLVHTTMEDVFIKVVQEAEAVNVVS